MRIGSRYKIAAASAVLSLVLAACGSGSSSPDDSGVSATQPSPTPTPALSATEPTGTPNGSLRDPASTPGGTTTEPTPNDGGTSGPTPTPTLRELGIVRFSTAGWSTDFYKHSVSYDEIVQAQRKDGIRSIDEPKFEDFDGAARWIRDREPVLAVEINGDARAYPLGILLWHEIVNDTIGGVPVAVTFCPLCNTALVFGRELDGRVLEFGVSGNLRNSDLIMFDRQTESWWQQVTGEAIVGELLGSQLRFLASSLVSFEDFRNGFPDGQVLSRDTGSLFGAQNYGLNPYQDYDNKRNTPFLFFGERDARLPLMERVVGLNVGGSAKAYPFDGLQEQRVIHDEVGGRQVVVFWKAGTTSALDDAIIAFSNDIGATGVFDPVVDGQRLTFEADGDGFIDEETGSVWNIFGKAESGPLQGERLEPIIHTNHFWFAWVAFSPDTLIYGME